MACIMVDKDQVESVLGGPPVEQFDTQGTTFVSLVSKNKEEDMTFAGLSFLVPRIYCLMELGWDHIAVDPDEGDVACP